VDVANEETPNNGNSGSPRENNGLSATGNGASALDKQLKKDHSAAHSPHSSISSNSSTPSSKHKEVCFLYFLIKFFKITFLITTLLFCTFVLRFRTKSLLPLYRNRQRQLVLDNPHRDVQQGL
jgi:hypothetical protein